MNVYEQYEESYTAGFKRGQMEAMKRVQAMFWVPGLPLPSLISPQEAFEDWKREGQTRTNSSQGISPPGL